VYYLSNEGNTAFLPAAWTDIGPKDPFVEQAQGRAVARVQDLLELVQLVETTVKAIKPQM